MRSGSNGPFSHIYYSNDKKDERGEETLETRNDFFAELFHPPFDRLFGSTLIYFSCCFIRCARMWSISERVLLFYIRFIFIAPSSPSVSLFLSSRIWFRVDIAVDFHCRTLILLRMLCTFSHRTHIKLHEACAGVNHNDWRWRCFQLIDIFSAVLLNSLFTIYIHFPPFWFVGKSNTHANKRSNDSTQQYRQKDFCDECDMVCVSLTTRMPNTVALHVHFTVGNVRASRGFFFCWHFSRCFMACTSHTTHWRSPSNTTKPVADTNCNKILRSINQNRRMAANGKIRKHTMATATHHDKYIGKCIRQRIRTHSIHAFVLDAKK